MILHVDVIYTCTVCHIEWLRSAVVYICTSVEFVQPLLLFAPFSVVSFEEAVVSEIIGIEADGAPEFLVLPVAAAA